MSKDTMVRTPIFDVYKGCEEEFKIIKDKVSIKFKEKMVLLGFKFVAEWIDWNFPILYNDVYLVEYKNYLYSVHFSAGTKNITIGDATYQRFDTIDMTKTASRNKTLLGYKINAANHIERLEGKERHPPNKSLAYRDLLRINKIAKLLNED